MFKRMQEDFVCGHCGVSVHGTGYTNHCPKCLWSKHVDNSPGDRANSCGGLMEPIRIEGSTPRYTIVHRCMICRVQKNIRVDALDDMGAIIELANNPKK